MSLIERIHAHRNGLAFDRIRTLIGGFTQIIQVHVCVIVGIQFLIKTFNLRCHWRIKRFLNVWGNNRKQKKKTLFLLRLLLLDII